MSVAPVRFRTVTMPCNEHGLIDDEEFQVSKKPFGSASIEDLLKLINPSTSFSLLLSWADSFLDSEQEHNSIIKRNKKLISPIPFLSLLLEISDSTFSTNLYYFYTALYELARIITWKRK